MKTIDGLEALIGEKIDVKNWKSKRLYFQGFGKDISAYFEDIDEEEFYPEQPTSGTALKVFTNAQQVHTWKINRAKEVKHEIMSLLHHHFPDYFVQPCEKWQDIIL